jgi:Papain family cysteine protease
VHKIRKAITMKKILLTVILIFAGFSPHAFAQILGKGLLLLPKDQYSLIPETPIATRGPLPISATLEDMFPKALSQGKLGSCTAWATTSVKAYRLFKASGQLGSPDTFRQSPAFVYSALTNRACNSGSYIHEALQFLRFRGSVKWEDLPYSENSCSDWRTVLNVAKNNSTIAYRVGMDPRTALSQIKSAIADGSPVVLAINACGEFDSASKGKVIREFGAENRCGAHAVVAVGYDDRLQAIRILNSWGSNWADEGKVWMDYRVFAGRFLQAYVDFGPDHLVNGSSHTPEWAKGDGAQVVASIPTAAAQALNPSVSADALGSSVRTTIGSSSDRGNSKWSIWLNLPKELSSQIDRVEYSFNHPTFVNPKRSVPLSSIFLANWNGWGCVDDATVKAFLSNGRQVSAKFNLCTVVARTEQALTKKSDGFANENPMIPFDKYVLNLIANPADSTGDIRVFNRKVYNNVVKLESQGRSVSFAAALNLAGVTPGEKVLSVAVESSRTSGYYVCLNASITNMKCSNGKGALSFGEDGSNFKLDGVIQ